MDSAGDDVEGWYTDPFDRHEARWFSAGAPSKLVRDGTVESNDPPPDEPFRRQPEAIQPRHPGDRDGSSISDVGPDPLDVDREILKIQTYQAFNDR